jgi:hypothetical protein
MAVAIIKRVALFIALYFCREKISENQLAIASKGSTVNLKDFKPIQVVEGVGLMTISNSF